MEAQKILSKGKVPANQEDINMVLEEIKEILLTYPDYMIPKANELYLTIRDKISKDTEKGIMDDIDARNVLRTRFYQTFAADIKRDEFDDKGRLKLNRKSRMWYFIYLHTRMAQMNSGEHFSQMHQIEAKRIMSDFNEATNAIIAKYKEYSERHQGVLPYEKSELKHHIDLFINQTHDLFRLYERNLEDYNINCAYERSISDKLEKSRKEEMLRGIK